MPTKNTQGGGSTLSGKELNTTSTTENAMMAVGESLKDFVGLLSYIYSGNKKHLPSAFGLFWIYIIFIKIILPYVEALS